MLLALMHTGLILNKGGSSQIAGSLLLCQIAITVLFFIFIASPYLSLKSHIKALLDRNQDEQYVSIEKWIKESTYTIIKESDSIFPKIDNYKYISLPSFYGATKIERMDLYIEFVKEAYYRNNHLQSKTIFIINDSEEYDIFASCICFLSVLEYGCDFSEQWTKIPLQKHIKGIFTDNSNYSKWMATKLKSLQSKN